MAVFYLDMEDAEFGLVHIEYLPKLRTRIRITTHASRPLLQVPMKMKNRDVTAIIERCRPSIRRLMLQSMIAPASAVRHDHTNETFHTAAVLFDMTICPADTACISLSPPNPNARLDPADILAGKTQSLTIFYPKDNDPTLEPLYSTITGLTKSLCKRISKPNLDQIVRRIGFAHGLVPNRVSCGSATTRWGSCSSRGDIRISSKAFALPLKMFRLLVLHELAHLKVHNHGTDFYDLLAQLYGPTAKQDDKALGRYKMPLFFD